MSTTGLGGLALGGGSGWIERQCGYTVDNLLAVEIVTADGRILTASEHEHPELFWGTRGGGGNFGVVTRFELRLHPIGPTVLGGMLLYPAAMAAGVLRNFRDVMAARPTRSARASRSSPRRPSRSCPRPLRGQPVVGVIVCYAGRAEDAEEALRPLREFGPPARRPRRADAVRGAAAADRRELPGRHAQPLDRRLPQRAAGRGDRGPVRASTGRCRPRSRRSSCSPAAAPPRACRTARWRSSERRRAVQRAHHVAVGGPGRRRREHRAGRASSARR